MTSQTRIAAVENYMNARQIDTVRVILATPDGDATLLATDLAAKNKITISPEAITQYRAELINDRMSALAHLRDAIKDTVHK